ncbi:MAG: HAD family phosphatase [Anaerolineae bacterium]|nr:HAD family phosphatase [Anaerolineae bacterium]
MSKTGINALIFDYGGVISKPQNPENIKRMLELVNQDYDDFMRVYTGLRPQFDSGQLSSDAYWTIVLEHLGIEATPAAISRLNHEDMASWTQINESMIRFLQQHRASIPKLAIISNMTWDTLLFMREHFQWLDLFDHLIFSCQLGIVKPDRAIYEACLDALAIPADECLFVDDSVANVRGAQAAGMAAIHFQTFDQFVLELGEIGFPGNGRKPASTFTPQAEIEIGCHDEENNRI